MPSEKFIENPREGEIPKIADVVIIGGGMAGPATAWALERLQPGIKTVLLEKAPHLAAGASTASIENFRTCWPSDCLAAVMLRSAEIFENPDEFLGEGAAQALNVKERGYLYCAFNDAGAQKFRAEVERLHAELGLTHVEFLGAQEVADRYPWIGENVVAAKVDPRAGWLDSNNLANLYARSAEGAKFLLGMENTRIVVEGGRVVGVNTNGNFIATEIVVIAAGAGSKEIGRTAGIDLPLVVRPRQSFVTSFRHGEIPPDAPFIIGNPAAYLRPESNTGAIFGWAYGLAKNCGPRIPNTEGYLDEPMWPVEKMKDPAFPSLTLALLGREFKHEVEAGFNDSRYLRGVRHGVGYYVSRHPWTTFKVMEDGSVKHYDSERALIQPCEAVQGLFLNTAHVGHGVMSSPACGEIAAALILGRTDDLDPKLLPIYGDFNLRVHYVPYDGGQL